LFASSQECSSVSPRDSVCGIECFTRSVSLV
jgi:hypothetical protein